MILNVRAEIKQSRGRSERVADPARAGCTKLFGTPKSLGNMVIRDIALASIAQLVVVMVYIWIVLSVVFRGANSMLCTLFGILTALTVYISAMKSDGDPFETQDLLLAPLELTKEFVVGQIVHVASKVSERIVVLLAEALRAATDDVKVEAKKL